MTSSSPELGWIADTSFIMCFGASKQARHLLWQAYQGQAGASPTVRHELERNASRNASHQKGKSAMAFAGRNAAALRDAPFLKCDEPERGTALSHLAHGTFPSTPAVIPPVTSELGDAPIDGDHVGEAESIAIAVRTGLPMLMTDRGAVAYAQRRGIPVESFRDALLRLRGTVPARQLFDMWITAKRHHYGGPGNVPGPSFFTVPEESGSDKGL